jgi:peptidoglycan/LPS O-acetylase OafA/YrhL
VNRRALRAVVSITLGLAGMCLVAYAFGRVTRTAWVWWLAPLTVALDGSRLLRARVCGTGAILSSSGLPTSRDLGFSIYLVSSIVAAGVAAWGTYTSNRLAVIVGAVVAILGSELERAP